MDPIKNVGEMKAADRSKRIKPPYWTPLEIVLLGGRKAIMLL
jgi:hypothetical protein